MSSGPTPELTDFEQRVLEILARGERVSDVAAILGLSMDEAQDCVRGVLAKLEPEPWASLSDRLDGALEGDHPHDRSP
jgi:DNA-binding NarL/FixJ family response regulator